MISKVCKDCKEDLKIDKFGISTKSRDGYKNSCKVCLAYYNNNLKRKHKEMRSSQDVTDFIQDLVESNKLFKCKSCSDEKTADNFYTKRDYNKIYLVQNRCKVCERYYQISRKFGITKDFYIGLLKSQNYKCKLCNVSEDEYAQQGYRNNLSVDHCHTTGVVRGLLCDKCNRGLGFFKEDQNTLSNAIKYLKEYDIV